MFLVMVESTSYLEPTGFAAARIDVRAFKVVIIPALAIETVCCSWWSSIRVGLPPLSCTYHHFV